MTENNFIAFHSMTDTDLEEIVGGATRVAPGVYCWDEPGKKVATCRMNPREAGSYTARTIGNGWGNYGPWNPRPGFGIIIP